MRQGIRAIRHHDKTGDPESLSAAAECFSRAVDAAPPGDRPKAMSVLAETLRRRFEATGDVQALAAAIAVSEAEVAETAPNSEDRCVALNDVGVCRLSRFEAAGDPADLEAAIASLEASIAEGDPASRARQAAESNLAGVLLRMYQEFENEASLERAIELFEHVHARHRRNVGAAVNLGNALLLRAQRTGGLADIDRAVEVTGAVTRRRRSVREGVLLYQLAGMAYVERFRLLRDPPDLDAAAGNLQQVVDTSQRGSTLHLATVSSLAQVFHLAYDVTNDGTWLERSLALTGDVVDELEPGAANRAQLMGVHGLGLLRRYLAAKAPEDLEQAVCRLEDAVQAAGRDSSYRATALSLLGSAVDARADATGDAAELTRARALSRESCQTSLTTEPDAALTTAYQWAKREAVREAWGTAADAYQLALAAMERLHRSQAIRIHKEVRLAPVQGLGGLAAGALARAGEPEQATVALERGRTVLLADALELSAGPADRPLKQDIWEAGESDPLVYFAAGDGDGVALIVLDGQTTAVPLPGVSMERLYGVVERHVTDYSQRRARPDAWRRSLDETCRWLWDGAIGPVLDAAALPTPAGGAAGTPVTVVATGPFALLPLHAAWVADARRPTGRRYAVDEWCISYAPSARAAVAARRLAAELPSERVLVVEEPRPVTASPLPMAALESAQVREHYPQATLLRHDDARSDRVLYELAQHDILHLVCHGRANPHEPLESYLLLARDGRLTLHDLLDADVRARLAVLSACETGMVGFRLLDEVVGLATGLLQAGASGVVAALWSVPDTATALLASALYDRLRDGDGLRPAAALREAQRWLRDSTNAEKLERFPEMMQATASRIPDAALPVWEAARGQEHPYYWSGMSHWGV